ncbi:MULTISPECIES: PIN domain-containing protein [Thermodesulfovibrio]|uniref:PIN domain-containing protein n=1 Tax=Thermodesulfovibrio yellowstonii TaxID=28262 RepID=UPI00040DA64E|nr:PIN domain-containing protein [Thermodesulfovibrio islandicus]
MHKAFLDSNVLLSALISELQGSYPSLIIKLGRLNLIELFISNLVEIEVRKNLTIKKPKNLRLFDEVLENLHKLEDVYIQLRELENLSMTDKIILSTAIYNRVDYFITGNTRDFKTLYGKKVINTTIVSPKEFFDFLTLS